MAGEYLKILHIHSEKLKLEKSFRFKEAIGKFECDTRELVNKHQ